MSHPIIISNLIAAPGGTGADNPVPLTIANYNLSAAELAQTLADFNVIALHTVDRVQKQVTAKVVVDPATGRPKTGPNDVAYLPCPPFCY